jgi:hypothetical protein
MKINKIFTKIESLFFEEISTFCGIDFEYLVSVGEQREEDKTLHRNIYVKGGRYDENR